VKAAISYPRRSVGLSPWTKDFVRIPEGLAEVSKGRNRAANQPEGRNMWTEERFKDSRSWGRRNTNR